MPEGAVYVGRPTKWGNPFAVGSPYFVMDSADYQRGDSLATAEWHFYTASDAVEVYEKWFRDQVGSSGFSLVDEAREELAGKDLACWCPLDQPCHADVLLRIAAGG